MTRLGRKNVIMPSDFQLAKDLVDGNLDLLCPK